MVCDPSITRIPLDAPSAEHNHKSSSLSTSRKGFWYDLGMLKDFIRAFYVSWGSGVTGTASAPLFAIAFFTNGIPRVLSVVLASLCFLSASYLIWVREKKRVVQLEKEVADLQGRPEVSLNILRMGGTLGGEWLFRLTNASDNTAINVSLTSVTDGSVRYEFDPIPSIVKSPASSNMSYHAIVPLASPLPSIPLPGDSRDMVKILGLGKTVDTETYRTWLEFSNYANDSTWQIEYMLECDYEKGALRKNS